MEDQTLMTDFAAKLSFAQDLLRSRLGGAAPVLEDDSGVGSADADSSMEQLFIVGQALGLTDKEVTCQVVLPVAELIRPGLAR